MIKKMNSQLNDIRSDAEWIKDDYTITDSMRNKKLTKLMLDLERDYHISAMLFSDNFPSDALDLYNKISALRIFGDDGFVKLGEEVEEVEIEKRTRKVILHEIDVIGDKIIVHWRLPSNLSYKQYNEIFDFFDIDIRTSYHKSWLTRMNKLRLEELLVRLEECFKKLTGGVA